MITNKSLKILIIVLVTAFLGEFKITPFTSTFRFGLGSAGFFFLLLFYKEVPYLLTGFITGIFTTLFRIALDAAVHYESFSFIDSFITRSPAIGYYVFFAIVLHIVTKRNDHSFSPMILGVIGVCCDVIANLGEITLHLIINDTTIIPTNVGFIIWVAIFRSFFVVGLFTMIESYRIKAIFNEQQMRFEQVQTILSNLYIEGFYLKKTLSVIEDITLKAHNLYQELNRNEESIKASRIALSIAQEVHEVKKDNQRILAGLEDVIQQEKTIKPLSLLEIVNLSIKANRKYIEFLRKNIELVITVHDGDFKTHLSYPLLIILNNLVANSIEAIDVDSEGFVKINVRKNETELIIEVIDNGPGIHPDEHDVIFEPGFSTKFTETGKLSNGIGLSHVKLMVDELQGSIYLDPSQEQTTFIVTLPFNLLI
jgi:two-component system sensor histidine kinase YcbA